MTAPSAVRRSFVRTNAPPLPGLTCWNSRILKTVPSTSMWLPFLNWLVLIMGLAGQGTSLRAGSGARRQGSSGPRAGWRHVMPTTRWPETTAGVRPVAVGLDPAAVVEREVRVGPRAWDPVGVEERAETVLELLLRHVRADAPGREEVPDHRRPRAARVA